MGRVMKDSGVEWIGLAPDSWECYTLSQLATQVKNKNTGMVENNLLSLSYGKIKKRSINAVGGLLPESFEGYNIIEPDDIVLRLTDLQNDHTSLRVGISTQKGIVTSAYLTIRLFSANYPKYIYYYLHTFDVCKGLYGMGAGVRQGLNWDGVKKLPILLPDVEEQHRIAEYLDLQSDKIDVLIDQIRTSIEEYKHMKQAVITQAVTKGVCGNRPMKDSGIEWLGEMPENWKIEKLKRLFFLITGTTPNGYDENIENGDEVVEWFTPGDINEEGSVLYAAQRKLLKRIIHNGDIELFPKGTILFVGIGASAGKVGYACVESYSNQQITALVLYSENCSKYFYYYMIADRQRIRENASYTTLPIINNSYLANVFVTVPPLNEQQEIASYLDEKCAEIDALIAQKEQLLTELENYKKSLIYEYVTGKKIVPGQ